MSETDPDFHRIERAIDVLSTRMGLPAVSAGEVIDQVKKTIADRHLTLAVAEGLMDEHEAAQSLLARMQTWLLSREGRRYVTVPTIDFSDIEREIEAAMFAGTPLATETVWRPHDVASSTNEPLLERLLIRPQELQIDDPKPAENARICDVGFLVESAALYRDVDVIANRGTLRKILEAPERDVFLELLESGHIKLTYQPEMLMVITNHHADGDVQDMGIGEIQGSDVLSVATESLIRTTHKPGYARRAARRLERLVSVRRWSESVLEIARKEAVSGDALRRVATAILGEQGDTRTSSLREFKLVPFRGAFKVDSNLRLPGSATRSAPGAVTEAAILAQYIQSVGDLHLLASYQNAAIATEPRYATLIRTLISSFSKAERTTAKFVFPEGRDLRRAVNEHTLTAREIVSLLDAARQARNVSSDLKSESAARDFLWRFTKSVPPGFRAKAYEWDLDHVVRSSTQQSAVDVAATVTALRIGVHDRFVAQQ